MENQTAALPMQSSAAADDQKTDLPAPMAGVLPPVMTTGKLSAEETIKALESMDNFKIGLNTNALVATGMETTHLVLMENGSTLFRLRIAGGISQQMFLLLAEDESVALRLEKQGAFSIQIHGITPSGERIGTASFTIHPFLICTKMNLKIVDGQNKLRFNMKMSKTFFSVLSGGGMGSTLLELRDREGRKVGDLQSGVGADFGIAMRIESSIDKYTKALVLATVLLLLSRNNNRRH